MKLFVRTFGTFFYIGYSPILPGTVGTFIATVILYCILKFSANSPVFIVLGCVLFTVFSIILGFFAKEVFGKDDPRQFILDEFAGIFVAVMFFEYSQLNIEKFCAISFVVFRVLDVLKPTPIKQIQKLPGGFGIVFDDLLAGVFTNLILRVILLLPYKFL